MPLRLKLAGGERVVINGAVLETEAPTSLLLRNRSDILRSKEMMRSSEANSPARLVYFSIQCAYLFSSSRDVYLKAARAYLADYLEAAPSSQALIEDIADQLAKEAYYPALRATHGLLAHEGVRLSGFDAAYDSADRVSSHISSRA